MKQHTKIKMSRSDFAVQVIIYILITLLCILIIYPFWYMLILSFNEGADATKGGIYFWPRKFTLFNYQMVLANPAIRKAYLVTIGRTVLGTFGGVFVTALAAYALAEEKLPGRKIFSYFILIPFIFNGGLIPYYLTLNELHLLNTFWVYVIPSLFNIWNMFVMKQFFSEIPVSLTEAATIDGAGEMTVLFKVVFPLSLPLLATMALFTAVGHWNSWFEGAYYVSSENLIPLQTYLQKLLNSMQASTQGNEIGNNMSASILEQQMATITTNSVRMASIMIATIPIMLVYPFLQKYFVKGVRIGSVKG